MKIVSANTLISKTQLWPISEKKLLSVQPNRIMLRTHEIWRILLVDRIIFIESDGNYCTFHIANDATLYISKTLKYFVDLLEGHEQFVRVHNRFLVNVQFVKSFNRLNELEFENYPIVASVSRRKKEILKQALSALCL